MSATEYDREFWRIVDDGNRDPYVRGLRYWIRYHRAMRQLRKLNKLS